MSIPVLVKSPEELRDPLNVTFLDHEVSATLNASAGAESQSLLILSLDDAQTLIYGPSETSLYKLSKAGGVTLQCHFSE
jgi:hypothetical protein